LKHHLLLTGATLTGVGGCDVKLPWELSRFQFLPALGKAYHLTGDERYAEGAVRLLRDWIQRNPCRIGVNWVCAMEVAIRVCNWLWGYWCFGCSSSWSESFSREFWASVWQHGTHIERNLEDWGRHRQNHYLADVAGLVFLGIVCPAFEEAERWRSFGITELKRCMEEQVNAEGVQFENSVAYHRLVLEFYTYTTLLCQKNGISLGEPFMKRLEQMFEFVVACTHSDGRVAHLGDSDDGRFFTVAQYLGWDRWDHRYLLGLGAVLFNRGGFKASAGLLPAEAEWFLSQAEIQRYTDLPTSAAQPQSIGYPHGGIYMLRSKTMEVDICAWNAGVNGLAPHKHNDSLHFVLNACGRPILVDSGTCCYTADLAKRILFRRTAAHNTIVIDGAEQCPIEGRYFGLDHVKGLVRVPKWKTSETQDSLIAEYDKGERGTATPVHRRIFRLHKSRGCLFVTDTFYGSGQHAMESYLHFAPGLICKREGYTLQVLMGSTLLVTIRWSPRLGNPILETGLLSQTYNTMAQAPLIKWSWNVALPSVLRFTFGIACSGTDLFGRRHFERLESGAP
jgi:uncharacterized heparinase superfamily protein